MSVPRAQGVVDRVGCVRALGVAGTLTVNTGEMVVLFRMGPLMVRAVRSSINLLYECITSMLICYFLNQTYIPLFEKKYLSENCNRYLGIQIKSM